MKCMITRFFDYIDKRRYALIMFFYCVVNFLFYILNVVSYQFLYDFVVAKNGIGIIFVIFVETIIIILRKIAVSRLSSFGVEMRSNQMKNLISIKQKIPYYYLENSEFNQEITIAFDSLSNPDGYEAIISGSINVFACATTLIGIMVFMIKVDVTISLLILFGILICIIISRFSFANKEYKEISRHKKRVNYFNSYVLNYENAKDFRVFPLVDKLLSLFSKSQEEMNNLKYEVNKKESRISIVTFLFRILIVVVCLFSLYKKDVKNNMIYLGLVFSLLQLYDTEFIELLKLNNGIKITKHYFDFCDKYLFQDKKVKSNFNDYLEFKNVYFRYPGSNFDVVTNVSFKINKGEKIAIVGSNGAGKSTIIKLLVGIYTPSCGQVIIDDKNIDDIYTRNLFSCLFQEFHVYAASLKDNIKALEFDDDSKFSYLFDKLKINTLSNNVNQELRKDIYNEGLELSSGQAQKIANARILYKDSDIYVFDEAYSAIDQENAYNLLNVMQELTKNKTIIMVVHDLKNMDFYDQILFVKDGKITERGNHKQLIELNGDYALFYKKEMDRYHE